jgi:hypothetical protein
MKDGKKEYIRTGPTIHAYTGNGTKKYTNAKSVTIKNIKKGKLSLKKGKTFKIRSKVNKINKKKKNLEKEIGVLKSNIDSLLVADSLSKKPLTAEAYLKSKLDEQKKALDAKYAALMDSVKILNLVNRKPITAVQWLEYNKHKKSTKLEKLDRKAEKLKK